MADDQAQSKEERKDFFISYTGADRRWAEWIAWHLEEAGYRTMLQAWDFHAGGNFVVDMDTATRQTERTIAVLSPDYFTSRFTPSQWAAAFRRDPRGEQGILLPVDTDSYDWLHIFTAFIAIKSAQLGQLLNSTSSFGENNLLFYRNGYFEYV